MTRSLLSPDSRRLLLILFSLVLLSGCEGQLSVTIQGDAPSLNGELTLQVDQIEFLHSDGNTQRFDLDKTLVFDGDGLSSTSLLSGEELREGIYEEVRLRVVAADSRYDDDGDNATDDLVLSGNTITAVADNRSFRMRTDDTESLTLHLATFASLPTADTGSLVQEFTPVMQLVRSEFSYATSVTLSAQTALDVYCADRDERLPRLYLFDTDDSPTNTDLDGADDDALRVVLASSSSSSVADRIWSLPRMAAGDYRLALSCDDDNPAVTEDITFFCSAEISVDSAGTIALDSATSDPSCQD